MSEVGCEPLVVGPSAEPWTLSLDVSNFPGLSGGGGTMDGEEDSSYMLFSRVRVGVSNCRWGPLAGPQCSVQSRWDRGVPVTVGEVAGVSCRSR